MARIVFEVEQEDKDKMESYAKSKGFNLATWVRVLCLNEVKTDLSKVVDTLGRLDKKMRLEVAKELYEAAVLSSKESNL